MPRRETDWLLWAISNECPMVRLDDVGAVPLEEQAAVVRELPRGEHPSAGDGEFADFHGRGAYWPS